MRERELGRNEDQKGEIRSSKDKVGRRGEFRNRPEQTGCRVEVGLVTEGRGLGRRRRTPSTGHFQ